MKAYREFAIIPYGGGEIHLSEIDFENAIPSTILEIDNYIDRRHYVETLLIVSIETKKSYMTNDGNKIISVLSDEGQLITDVLLRRKIVNEKNIDNIRMQLIIGVIYTDASKTINVVRLVSEDGLIYEDKFLRNERIWSGLQW